MDAAQKTSPKSVLDVEVSCFASYFKESEPRPVNLLTWLRSGKYAEAVERLRTVENKTERDRLKAQLPAITPSGTFTRREAGCLVRHSGLLQFDIDLKENRHLGNYADLKDHLRNLPSVAYCGLSASGLGFWGLVPIARPEQHGAHFDALKAAFAGLGRKGIVLDGKPRNVASLRGYSFDPDGYFNHQARPFTALHQPAPVRPRPFVATPGAEEERAKVEAIVGEIVRRGVDLTADYGDWCALGFALVSEFGEGARDLFHQVSQFHPKYERRECDRQFTYLVKDGSRKITLGTFFHLASLAGIEPSEDVCPPAPAPGSLAVPVGCFYKRFTSGPKGPFSVLIGPDGYPANWDL